MTRGQVAEPAVERRRRGGRSIAWLPVDGAGQDRDEGGEKGERGRGAGDRDRRARVTQRDAAEVDGREQRTTRPQASAGDRDAGQVPLLDRGGREERGQRRRSGPSPTSSRRPSARRAPGCRAGRLRRRRRRCRRRGSATSGPARSSPARRPSSGAGRRSAAGRRRCPGRGCRPDRRTARRSGRGSGCCRPWPARSCRPSRSSAGAGVGSPPRRAPAATSPACTPHRCRAIMRGSGEALGRNSASSRPAKYPRASQARDACAERAVRHSPPGLSRAAPWLAMTGATSSARPTRRVVTAS